MDRATLKINLLLITMLSLLSGCAHHPELPTASSVDLDRFMGLWYVQGYTPILVDKEAHNAVEHYYNAGGGKIETTYQFRKGGFDGELKTYTPKGQVVNTVSNSEWTMQFIWPFKAQYLIYYVAEDYSTTIIAHPNRKNAWIMNRSPEIDESVYDDMIQKLIDEGFDKSSILKVPHDWSKEDSRVQTYSIFEEQN